MYLMKFQNGIPISLKSLVECCIETLPLPNLTHLMAHLTSNNTSVAFSLKFWNRYYSDSDNQEEAFKMLIDKTIDHSDCSVRPIPLCALLDHREDTTWINDAVIRKLPDYLDSSQLTILMCLSKKSLSDAIEMFRSKSKMLAIWMEGMMVQITHVHGRYALISTFLNAVEEESDWNEFYNFMQTILDNSSTALPYLYAAVTDEQFEDLIDTNPTFRTKLLKASFPKDTKTAIEVITYFSEKKGRREQLLNNALLKMKSELENEITFAGLMGIIAFALTDDIFMNNYTHILQQVPPFIIALGMLHDNYRNLLLQASPYLEDEQLKAMAMFINSNTVIQDIKQLPKELIDDQYQTIINHLRYPQLKIFLRDKTHHSQEGFKKLLVKEVKIQEDLNRLQKLKGHLFESKYEKLYDKLQGEINGLMGLFRSFTGPTYCCLRKKCIQVMKERPKEQSRIGAIPTIVEKAQEHLKKFRAPEGYLKLLLKLEPEVEEEEEISAIYWELIKYKHLVHLRVHNGENSVPLEHLGKLYDYGISSDRDFELLGLTHKRRIGIDKICTELNTLASNDKALRIYLEESLIQALGPTVNIEALYAITSDKELKEKLNIKALDHEVLMVQTKELIQKVQDLPIASKADLEKLVKTGQLLESVKVKSIIQKHCEDTIVFLIKLLKNYESKKQIEIHDQWEKLLDPGVEIDDTDFNKMSSSIMSVLNIQDGEAKTVHMTLCGILETLLEMKSISDKERQNLQKALDEAKVIEDSGDVFKWADPCLLQIIHLIKSHDFIETLQRYLKQPYLTSKWQGFRDAGITTVRGLVKQFKLEDQLWKLFDFDELGGKKEPIFPKKEIPNA